MLYLKYVHFHTKKNKCSKIDLWKPISFILLRKDVKMRLCIIISPLNSITCFCIRHLSLLFCWKCKQLGEGRTHTDAISKSSICRANLIWKIDLPQISCQQSSDIGIMLPRPWLLFWDEETGSYRDYVTCQKLPCNWSRQNCLTPASCGLIQTFI